MSEREEARYDPDPSVQDTPLETVSSEADPPPATPRSIRRVPSRKFAVSTPTPTTPQGGWDETVGEESNYFVRICARVQSFSQKVVEHRFFGRVILMFILVATLLQGLQTDGTYATDPTVDIIEKLTTAVFCLEQAIKILSCLRRPWEHFLILKPFELNYWNIFDFIVVLLSLINIPDIAVIRLFRLLRILRLLRQVPALQMILFALVESMGSIMYILLLLVILFFIFAVIGTTLFKTKDAEHFGDLPSSLLALFSVATGASWAGLMYPVVFECDDDSDYPICTEFGEGTGPEVLYFCLFVLLSSMVLLNLVIGVITQSMSEMRKATLAVDDTDTTLTGRKGGIRQTYIFPMLRKMRLMRSPVSEEEGATEEVLRRVVDELNEALEEHARLLTSARVIVSMISSKIKKSRYEARDRVRLAVSERGKRVGVFVWALEKIFNGSARVIKSIVFQVGMLLVVILAVILIAVGTWDSVANSPVFSRVEYATTIIFLIELALGIFSCGWTPWLFFFHSVDPLLRPHWFNMIDTVVVIVGFLDSKQFFIIRIVRLLRILKIIRIVPMLRRLLAALIKSIQSMFYVFLLLLLLLYVWGVLGVYVFSDNDPVHFGTLALAMLTLLQCATGDDWSEILYIAVNGCATVPEVAHRCVDNQPKPVIATMFFVTFMLCSSVVALNLVIGIINSSMEETTEKLNGERELKTSEHGPLIIDLSSINLEGAQRLAEKLRQNMSEIDHHVANHLLSSTKKRRNRSYLSMLAGKATGGTSNSECESDTGRVEVLNGGGGGRGLAVVGRIGSGMESAVVTPRTPTGVLKYMKKKPAAVTVIPAQLSTNENGASISRQNSSVTFKLEDTGGREMGNASSGEAPEDRRRDGEKTSGFVVRPTQVEREDRHPERGERYQNSHSEIPRRVSIEMSQVPSRIHASLPSLHHAVAVDNDDSYDSEDSSVVLGPGRRSRDFDSTMFTSTQGDESDSSSGSSGERGGGGDSEGPRRGRIVSDWNLPPPAISARALASSRKVEC